jgi:hypothetical protein
VREDYSPRGDAWDYLSHDQARSRAYRWGEDGIGGFGDERLRICLAVALWNGHDPMLKERLFGLTNAEGNHGEDVKELYYYLDGVPSHAYMRMLYKYPQAEFPYVRLVEENRQRGLVAPEFEILDAGIFDDSRYFDVTVEYAKADIEDILMQVTVANRAAEPATLHLVPQCWARDIWSWKPGAHRPVLRALPNGSVQIIHKSLGDRRLYVDGSAELLFCDNETNPRRLYGDNAPGYFKDGINDCIVSGAETAVNPMREGTKMAAHYRLELPGHGTARVRLRLRPAASKPRRSMTSTRSWLRGRLKPTSSTPCCSRASPMPTPGSCSVRRWPACCGRNSSISSTCHSGSQVIPRNLRRRLSGAPVETATGSTSTMPTSSRCPTNGNIPGTPPGTWPFTA